jgi:hypothetical protein
LVHKIAITFKLPCYNNYMKKGNLGDMMFITVFFLAFCMVTIIAYLLWTNMVPTMTTTFSQMPGGMSANSQLAIDQTTMTLLSLDSLFAFMIIGTFIAIVISSFWLNTHPVFFIITLLAFIFQFTIYAILGNVWGNFETDPAVQAAASNFGLMEAIWQNIPTIALFFGAVVIIILFSKIRGKPNAYAS